MNFQKVKSSQRKENKLKTTGNSLEKAKGNLKKESNKKMKGRMKMKSKKEVMMTMKMRNQRKRKISPTLRKNTQILKMMIILKTCQAN